MTGHPAYYDVDIARHAPLQGLDAPPDCLVCARFADGLERLPLTGPSWWQRGKLIIRFRDIHHLPGNLFEGVRSHQMIAGLKVGGWRYEDLRRVAELVLDSGLEVHHGVETSTCHSEQTTDTLQGEAS